MCLVVYNECSVYECVHNQLVFVYMAVYSTSRCLSGCVQWVIACMDVYCRVGVCVYRCAQ